jgi:hypothetical protein
MTWFIAQLAIATSIAPNDLLDTPPSVLAAMANILNEQGKKARQRGGRQRR